jgi:hypothetical protein
MLSELSQVQKDKDHIFFFHMWKIDQNINTRIIIYTYAEDVSKIGTVKGD